MAKLTVRDHIWAAALKHESQGYRNGFTSDELLEVADLDASRKTVADTLESMCKLGFLAKVETSGGGRSARYVNGRE